jgi:hypothetical protein
MWEIQTNFQRQTLTAKKRKGGTSLRTAARDRQGLPGSSPIRSI